MTLSLHPKNWKSSKLKELLHIKKGEKPDDFSLNFSGADKI